MGWGLLAFLAILVAAIAIPLAAIAGAIDARGRRPEAWDRAGFRRSTWVYQAVGALCPPLAVFYTGAYFAHVRHRLLAAERDLAAAPAFEPVRGGVPAHGERVRIRMSVVALLVTVVPLALLMGVNVIDLRNAGLGSPTTWVFYALLLGALVALNAYFGVTLTSREAIINGLRRRRLAWHEVTAVVQERSMGSTYVRVWTADGRSYRLRAPFVPFFGIGGRHFEKSFHLIGRWWLDHRGSAPVR